MTRGFSPLKAVLVALLLAPLTAAVAVGAPHHKRRIYHWHGYGFLPGYHPPPENGRPIYGERGAIGGTPPGYPPDDAPTYWYGGNWYYFGRPGFYRGRYNGGSFGPCWTPTPIGPMWNCGG